ncbi:MAG: hypothetical protein GY906_23335 [bacterium]|nr:hypothetical protein [bacterium]
MTSPSADFVLFSELLVDLCGTFAYGFIARQLLRDRRLVGGNRALRWLAACVAFWYLGCLVDEVVAVLVPGRPWFGTTLDVSRGLSWLAVFPLLVHAVWRLAGDLTEGSRHPSRLWLVPGYVAFAAFCVPAITYWRSGHLLLAATAGELVWPIITHTTVLAVMAAFLLTRTHLTSVDLTLQRFIRWFLFTLLLVVIALVLCVRSPEADWLRLTAQGVGLGPAMVLLLFVQRHTILKLSVSLTTLRHFMNAVVVVVLIMAAGPVINADGSEVFRRLVAWSVLLALLGGTAYSALTEVMTRRSAALRRFIEPTVPIAELEDLLRNLRSFDSDRRTLQRLVTESLQRWLGTGVRFVDSEPMADELMQYFADPDTRGSDLVDASAPVAEILSREGLHAAFPLRVAGCIDEVLVIESGIAGGGVRAGENEAIELVLGQLATVLDLQSVARARLAAEQRSFEHERLSTLGLVAASLAHEVKNPLASMKALAQTVHEELKASAQLEQATDLAAIVDQIDRLDQVTREILGFAKPRSGDNTDLAAITRSAVYILRAEARRRGVIIEAEQVHDVGPVAGSTASWQSVVFNLLLNAVKHAPNSTSVTARLSRINRDSIVFETTNGGPAIDSAVAKRIFEPFVSHGGTGLGLSVVARRAEDLGATIRLSNNPGEVRFTLSIKQVEV